MPEKRLWVETLGFYNACISDSLEKKRKQPEILCFFTKQNPSPHPNIQTMLFKTKSKSKAKQRKKKKPQTTKTYRCHLVTAGISWFPLKTTIGQRQFLIPDSLWCCFSESSTWHSTGHHLVAMDLRNLTASISHIKIVQKYRITRNTLTTSSSISLSILVLFA